MAKSTTPSTVPADRLAAYDRLIATQPGLQRKGAKIPYTSVNGHMTSYLDQDGTLALRLPSGARQAFLKRHQTTLQEAYGVVQKEYVRVPADLLDDTAALAPDFAASLAYVSALKPKPKPTKRSTTRTPT